MCKLTGTLERHHCYNRLSWMKTVWYLWQPRKSKYWVKTNHIAKDTFAPQHFFVFDSYCLRRMEEVQAPSTHSWPVTDFTFLATGILLSASFKCGSDAATYRGILLMGNTYRTKKTLGDRTFENVAPKVWNQLPLEIRQCQSLNAFKFY